MTDAEFEKQKARVQAVWDKWAKILHLDHYYINITWERKYDGDKTHWLASTQTDWHYRQMFVFFYLPKIETVDDDQLDNLVLHEIAHMFVSPLCTTESDSQKLEFATENVARALEDVYKACGSEEKLSNKENNMSSSETALEKEIKAKGLTAPRVTPEQLDAKIVDEKYHVFEGTTVTVCALVLQNGFVVVGESAAASPDNFDEEIGRKIARDNARNKIWALEGYLLRERLSQEEAK